MAEVEKFLKEIENDQIPYLNRKIKDLEIYLE